MKYFFRIMNKIHYISQYFIVIIFQKHSGLLRSIARTTAYPKIRKFCWTKTGIIFGKDVYINHSIYILDGGDSKIEIGDRVSFSPNVTLITNSSPNDSILAIFDYSKQYIKCASIKIGDDSWIGAGSIIQPGVTIGKGCIIGSMSNVTKDIPDNYIAFGNPAKLIKKVKDD